MTRRDTRRRKTRSYTTLDVFIVRMTKDAICVGGGQFGRDKDIWIPRTCIASGDDITDKDEQTLQIETWLLKNEGML